MASTTDKRYQAQRRAHERRREEEKSAALAFVMSSPDGRRFMYDLLFNRCGLMNVYSSNDAGIHRHEGRRALGVEIGNELQEKHAEEWLLMITERMTEQREDKAVREARSTTEEEGDAE